MRRWMLGFLSFMLVVSWTVQVVAAEERSIQVFVNGKALVFDVAPAVVSGRTLVPLRVIFEALGAEVTWDGVTKTVNARWDGGELQMQIGAGRARVRGQDQLLDVPGQIVQDRTMVPLRFVAEAVGAQVGWYGQSRIITINKFAKPLVAATVARVVDGDTIEVTFTGGGTEKVRIIGVDTPETVHPTKGAQPGGKVASDFTKGKLTGQQVLLELDVEERDRYGRMLAYAYMTNGTMFNAVLADEGLARMATFPPNVRYVAVFRALQADAQAAGRGLWEGAVTAPGAGTQPPQYDPAGPDRDCGDFKTQTEAQAFFEAAGGPDLDRHRLDADRNGVVCETLP